MKIKFIYLFIIIMHVFVLGFAQNTNYYFDNDNNKHFQGKISPELLAQDSSTRSWFSREYNSFDLGSEKLKWKNNLEDVHVTIFMGTWCGDSQLQVPRFIKLWDTLGLSRSQFTIIAVHDGSQPGKYKQSPSGEEINRFIHRVPVFIFEKNGSEIARIVEFPKNDMLTDVAQIALGYPSLPNYEGANFMMRLLSDTGITEYKNNKTNYDNFLQWKISSPRELNTLGYVYLESNRIEQALICFSLNCRLFPYDINAYDSYAEGLLKNGETEKAIEMYERILLFDRNNETARKQISKIKEN